MISFGIRTQKKKEVVDITEQVNAMLAGKGSGVCHLFLQHTTAALTTADLDPGTDLDMLDALEALSPKLPYRHPHNPAHAPDHILSSLIGASLAIPVKDGSCMLGAWQRIVLIEFSGPREREITLSF